MQHLRELVAVRPRLSFLFLNLTLLTLSMVTLSKGEAPPFGVWITGPAVLLLLAGRFLRARSRWRQGAILYLGFVAFCWSMTLYDLGGISQEVQSLADLPSALGGLVMRGVAFALFGHIFGLPWLVVTILVNLVLFRPAADGGEPAPPPAG